MPSQPRGYQPLTQSSVREQRRSEVKTAAVAPKVNEANSNDANIPMRAPPPVEPYPFDKAHEWYGPDIVQFSSPFYYVEEEEGGIEIDIIRIGSAEGEVEVSYHTEDGTAKEGIRYEGSEGRVVMKDGETNYPLRINIAKDDGWANIVEFKVHLTGPEVNCELGTSLSTCRVKVIDSALFPSDKYHNELMAGKQGIYKIPQLAFIWEYVKLNFDSGMLRPCILMLIFDQLTNLYLLFSLQMKIYLVDKILTTNPEDHEDQENRHRDLLFYAIAYVSPLLLLHLWARARIKLAVMGKSRLWLQSNLFAKYLDYSAKSLSEHSPGALHGSVFTDSPNIAEGFVRFVGLGQRFGKIIILTYVMVKKDHTSWIIAISIPIIMVLFGWLMDTGLQEAAENKDDRLDELVEFVDEVVDNFTLVSDYFQRPKMNESFNARVAKYNAGVANESLLGMHCSFFIRYLSSAVITIFIVRRGPALVSGQMSLGVFLALIGVFGKVVTEYGALFIEMSTVKRLLFVGLKDVAAAMNLETELAHMKKASRQRRKATKSLRQQVRSQAPSSPLSTPPTDHLPFELRSTGFWHEGQTTPILLNASLSAHQGSLICIAGAHGSGRSSVMRLLAHKIFPNSGMIFIPAHCCILHVSPDPHILNMSVWENLCFGNSAADEVTPDRVRAILQKLDLPIIEKYVDYDVSKKEGDKKRASKKRLSETDSARGYSAHWHHYLSESQKCKLHLARAFIMNPEVLVLQRPLKHFDPDTSHKIMGLIRLHMYHRGIGLPLETAGRRRPRTVFFTAENRDQENAADVIWRLDGNKSITSSLGQGQPYKMPRFNGPSSREGTTLSKVNEDDTFLSISARALGLTCGNIVKGSRMGSLTAG